MCSSDLLHRDVVIVAAERIEELGQGVAEGAFPGVAVHVSLSSRPPATSLGRARRARGPSEAEQGGRWRREAGRAGKKREGGNQREGGSCDAAAAGRAAMVAGEKGTDCSCWIDLGLVPHLLARSS